MDLEVVGRHALLFDDDAMAAFVNSVDALLQWNSLLIDRYDVRHLLQQVPPRAKKRRAPPVVEPDGVSRIDLDNERYLDLPPEDEGDVASASEKPVASAVDAYNSVGFSYENMSPYADHRNSDASLGNTDFHPPFPLPESLQNSIPPTEKLHQIIARTSKFVSVHGGQSEIVLRVKQGDNPTFGFLMPDHHLHPYFRFLADHQELLQPDTNPKPNAEKNGGGALSLLGSVYGEDDDGPDDPVLEAKQMQTGKCVESLNEISHTLEPLETSTSFIGGDRATLMRPLGPANEKPSLSKRKLSVSTVCTGSKETVKKRDSENFGSLGIAVCKQQTSPVPSTLEAEPFILEPPSSVKRTVDKIVEFIRRNGKESEAILIEQDSTSESFPFLLPQNQYHPYYLKTLQKAQEANLPKKSNAAVKQDSLEHAKGTTGYKLMRENNLEGIYDTQRKEKFKMVIGGSKKGTQNAHSKTEPQHSGVSADAAAAIVMAATRGVRNPKLDSLATSSPNGSAAGLGAGDGGPQTSFGSVSFSCQPNSSMSRPVSNGEMPSDLPKSTRQFDKSGNRASDVSLGKAMAKSAALAAASEADSSEASMTKEQKQKAERLKRAKMFATIIKSGAHPIRESLSQLSVAAPDSAISGCKSGSNHSALLDLVEREGKGSPASVDVDKFKGKLEKGKNEDHDSDSGRSRKKHSSKSGKCDKDLDRDHKSSRKRRQSEHSADKETDHHKHRKRYRESRHKYELHSSSEDEHRHRRSHKHHHTSEDRHGHRSRHNKHYSSSEDEHRQRSSRSHKRRKSSHAERVPMADDEIKKLETVAESKEGLSEISNSLPLGSKPSDELRAKVRAMLLATL
ncbi:uncharacterized protein [Aristolochia californica]|uniref:uncharacterized protein n=1 Tax=Aristolochia californica TaxID=171875 RepID=UPI0035D7F336